MLGFPSICLLLHVYHAILPITAVVSQVRTSRVVLCIAGSSDNAQILFTHNRCVSFSFFMAKHTCANRVCEGGKGAPFMQGVCQSYLFTRFHT